MPDALPDHFSSVAPGYAAFRPRYPEALFAYLASLPARRDLAWDSGAGSGQAALGLAPYFGQVLATDASAAQIAVAAAHPRVGYRVAAAHESGLAAATVDLVAVAQALHWFALPAFYTEVARVLAPGGVLAVWCYGLLWLDDARLDDLVQRFYTATVGPFWPPERRIVEAGYRTLRFPFAEISPPAFVMTAEWRLWELLGFLSTWSAVTRCRKATGRDPVGDLAPALAPLWGGDRVRTIRWPLSVRIGRNAAT